jgi:hypothetical protein
MSWQEGTLLGYAAVGIVVGFGVVMMLAPLHQDFALATWIWFPIGLAIRSSSTKVKALASVVGGIREYA